MTEISGNPPLAGSRTFAPTKTVFLWLMALTTLAPILFILLSWPIERDGPGAASQALQVIAILSTAHVALTGYFYVDPEYRAHIGKNKVYHIGFPVALIAVCGAATALLPGEGRIYVMVVYHAWLLYHYGRQNFGILSFTSAATGGVRPLNSERIALHLAPIGGILGANAVLSDFRRSPFADYIPTLTLIGQIFAAAAIAAAVFAIARHLMLKQSPWRSAMLLMFACFYLPTFFFTQSYTTAVMSYAYAHALQYFVFMYFIAAGARSLHPAVALAALAVVTAGGWQLIMLSRQPDLWGPLGPAMPGIALALIMWHFIMDADLWRLSQPWQRDEVRSRFSFIFDKNH